MEKWMPQYVNSIYSIFGQQLIERVSDRNGAFFLD